MIPFRPMMPTRGVYMALYAERGGVVRSMYWLFDLSGLYSYKTRGRKEEHVKVEQSTTLSLQLD